MILRHSFTLNLIHYRNRHRGFMSPPFTIIKPHKIMFGFRYLNNIFYNDRNYTCVKDYTIVKTITHPHTVCYSYNKASTTKFYIVFKRKKKCIHTHVPTYLSNLNGRHLTINRQNDITLLNTST